MTFDPASSGPVDRRRFLKTGALGVGALASATSSGPPAAAAEGPEPPDQLRATPHVPLVDVNVSVSRWPFRRVPGDETPDLVAKLRAQGVVQAWAGSFDALLHRDIAGVNARLAAECRTHGDGILVPFGAVNPMLPDWEDDVRRCHDEHGMPGVRLHPNYHQYRLDDSAFARLLDAAARRNLIVQIAVTMEDERTQHPLLQVAHVDVSPLLEHARRLPNLRIVVLNLFRSVTAARVGKLIAADNVLVDIAMLEGVGGVANLVRQIPAERVLFGSYAPFFYFESALFKLRESPLDGQTLRAIGSENARRVLKAR